MTNLQKFTYARLCQESYFWVGIPAFFFANRGISPEQTYILYGIFSVSIILWELPTGLIADRISYKLSWSAGMVLMGSVFLSHILPFSFFGFCILFFMSGIAAALSSGAHQAILHQISDDFRKDMAHVRFITLLWRSAAIIVGAQMFLLWPELPYVVTAVAYIIGAFIVQSIDAPLLQHQKEKTHSSLETAQSAFVDIVHSPALVASGIFFALTGAITIGYKWILPGVLGLDGDLLVFFATGLTVGALMMALGSKAAGLLHSTHAFAVSVLAFALCFLMIGFTPAKLAISFMAVGYFFKGYFDVQFVTIVNTLVADHVRASTMSIFSMGSRLLGAAYAGFAAVAVGLLSAEIFVGTVAALLGIAALAMVYFVLCHDHAMRERLF